MFESPFGEKFHFRSALSVDLCKARINQLGDAPLLDLNFSDDPVGLTRRNRFWLYENSLGEPPSLSGKLVSNRGWTEIIGRAGSNRTSFWSAVATFVLFVAAGAYTLVSEGHPDGVNMLLLSVPVAAYMYWHTWKDPGASKLIDHLQHLLEAEPMPQSHPRTMGRR